MSTVSVKDKYRTEMNEDVYCNEPEVGCYTNKYVRWLEHQVMNNLVSKSFYCMSDPKEGGVERCDKQCKGCKNMNVS